MPHINRTSPTSAIITGSAQIDRVDAKSIDYLKSEHLWRLIEDLLGGTNTMRRAEKVWLPQEPKETATAYRVRLHRSFLFNGLRDTIDKLGAKPFVKPIQFEGDLPESLEEFHKDVDANGTTLQQFSSDFFNNALRYGINFCLVDFTSMDTEEEQTLEEQRAAGGRPMFIQVTPPQLIGWKIERNEKNEQELTEIRIEETTLEQTGTYLDEEVRRIRVYTKTDWQVWKENKSTKGDTFELESSGVNTLGIIPLVPYYINKLTMMTGKPPFEDLAWSNLAHWQSASDQRNILRYVRFGILYAAGFSEEEIKDGLVVGPSSFVKSTNPEAKLSFVEHSGAGIEAGSKDLMSLKEEMAIQGAQPLLQTSNVTATAKMIDEGRSQAAIQSWIANLEGALRSMYLLAALWLSEEISDEFKINIFNDFVLSLRASEDITALTDMRKNGLITEQTFLNEIKRRGILSENVDIDDETAKLKVEGSDMGVLGKFINGDDLEPDEIPDDEDEEDEDEE